MMFLKACGKKVTPFFTISLEKINKLTLFSLISGRKYSNKCKYQSMICFLSVT